MLSANMDTIVFRPSIDVPLVLATVALFIREFKRSAVSNDLDTNVDLVARLPSARTRVISLFAAVLLICWLSNLAVWSLFAVLLAFGIVFAFLSGADIIGAEIGLWATAYLIREWCFGFPKVILEPPEPATITQSAEWENGELLGKMGVASAPIRPTGLAEIDNQQVTVSSADGRFIEAGTEVVVSAYRNGCPCVMPCSGV